MLLLYDKDHRVGLSPGPGRGLGEDSGRWGCQKRHLSPCGQAGPVLPNVPFKKINQDFGVKSPGVGEPSNNSFKRELADQSAAADPAWARGPHAPCCWREPPLLLPRPLWPRGGDAIGQEQLAPCGHRPPGGDQTPWSCCPRPRPPVHHRGTDTRMRWATRPCEGRQRSQAS